MLDIVILAAGKGTRMKSGLPKVLHPVAGRPLLQHVIDTARRLDSDAINVVIGHGADRVEAHCAAPDVHFVLQAEQLGTGHAVQQAVGHLRDNAVVLVLYGDVPLIREETLRSLIAKVGADAMALLTVELDDPSGYGRIVRDSNGAVTAIVEQKEATPEQLSISEINTGVMAMRGVDLKRWLPQLSSENAQREYYLTDVIALAQGEGKVVNTEQPADELEVLGVNNHQQQAQLERFYQRDLAATLMAEGLTLLDPDRFDCRGSLSVGEDVTIDINCVFEGRVTLGNNVSIGPNCCLKNVVIGDNVVIKPNSLLEEARVADNCEIGPFARVRPGTELSDGAKVGNFVEIKKALIGPGSKVNHLSYVGDAQVGSGVNIGAGTITCNYDGVNKFKTEIGDDAFIGSNTALVAPVKVGKGATVGAGSTVTKAVADDQLTIARGKQRNIEGWQRPTKNK
ncbi:UDP-N-acetylglucosamine diphosphorylase/glucosamine-1-phosphate N-acetyltransferase [Exilibacterium tricleocarpae]|uniref:Bifunctional protein GlmU n=1 Tax=Exilibacterium tricleocarpae TaxID=2591008 RepID=A0A545TZQ8_9GAMM|nr:bifunctional UDP-N-acetylglucosamine diphosphorylase/glucosamine-1-phosphate N-acetyltransferase GlmU [Exilibacterium tricleocarpae]TQV82697.1 UDP-N-acetylglucosamine diphosphorylase/glucosamine-1-phosphate N-acetyltransferase [Exilibacterium tricleocarpae]